MQRSTANPSAVVGLAMNVVAPLVLYYGLRAAGVAELAALIVTTVPPAVHTIAQAIRRRSADALGILVLIGAGAGIVLSLLSGSPRELLVRHAWVSAPLSLWTLATLRAARPMTFVAARTLLPHRAAVMDALWDSSASFRTAWRRITITWGVVLVIDAGLRVVVAMRLPVDIVPAVDAAVSVGTVIALQLPTHLLLARSGHWRTLFARPWPLGRQHPTHRLSQPRRPAHLWVQAANDPGGRTHRLEQADADQSGSHLLDDDLGAGLQRASGTRGRAAR